MTVEETTSTKGIKSHVLIIDDRFSLEVASGGFKLKHKQVKMHRNKPIVTISESHHGTVYQALQHYLNIAPFYSEDITAIKTIVENILKQLFDGTQLIKDTFRTEVFVSK